MKPNAADKVTAVLLCIAALFTCVTLVQISSAPPVARQAVLPTVTPRPVRPANQWQNAPCGCAYDAYSCEDFRDVSGAFSQPGAQICYNYCMDQVGYDIHQLVTDDPNDVYVISGLACVAP